MKYVVIETYTNDFMQVNGYDIPYNIIGVYDNELIALQKLENEVDFQCNGEDNEWNWRESKYSKDTIISAKDLYYHNDYNYSILVEKVEVENERQTY